MQQQVYGLTEKGEETAAEGVWARGGKGRGNDA